MSKQSKPVPFKFPSILLIVMFAIVATVAIRFIYAASITTAIEVEDSILRGQEIASFSGDGSSNNSYVEFIDEQTTPPPDPDGCYVTIEGSLYNMAPHLLSTAVSKDRNGDTVSHAHSASDLFCGSLSAPTDVTNHHRDEHIGHIGCIPPLLEFYAGPGDPPPDLTPRCPV